MDSIMKKSQLFSGQSPIRPRKLNQQATKAVILKDVLAKCHSYEVISPRNMLKIDTKSFSEQIRHDHLNNTTKVLQDLSKLD
jgi:hypothetical protein